MRHALVTDVLARLGFPDGTPPSRDLAGLTALYRAWGHAVPFDNLRKLIALRTDPPGTPLPGLDADDFFTTWLAHGAGGTCWSSSNALHELLRVVGFDARRIAGSMRDTGMTTHGSVLVHFDGADSGDWLVDTSMLHDTPLPVHGIPHVHRDGAAAAEIEPLDDLFMLWTRMPSADAWLPCRFVVDPDTHEGHAERYEISRTQGGFNQRVYVRCNRGDEQWSLAGPTLARRGPDGIHTDTLTPELLIDVLHDDIGMSDELLTRFIECGALVESFAPPSFTPAPLTSLPPSLR